MSTIFVETLPHTSGRLSRRLFSRPSTSEQSEFIRRWNRELESYDSQQILDWTFEHFGPKLAMTTSLGLSGWVIVSMLSKMERRIPIFHVDDGYRTQEIFRVHARIRETFGVDVIHLIPDVSFDPDLERLHARSQRINEINDRKTQIFTKIAPAYEAWICGARREHSGDGPEKPILQWDSRFGLIRVAPLVRWTRAALQEKIQRSGIPYQALPTEEGCDVLRASEFHSELPDEEGDGFGERFRRIYFSSSATVS